MKYEYAMLENYFQKIPPFDYGKPYEFKDAIYVRSVLLEIDKLSKKSHESGPRRQTNLIFKEQFDIHFIVDGDLCRDSDGNTIWIDNTDELQYLIVSNDKGVRTSFQYAVSKRPNEDVKIFEKLADLLDYLAKQNYMSAILGELVSFGYGMGEIEESARVAIEAADIEIEGYEGCLEEVDLDKVELVDAKINVIGMQEFSDETCLATINVDATVVIDISFSYMNEDQSYWDRETKSYLWRTIDQNEAQYSAGVELTLQFDVTDLKAVLCNKEMDTNIEGRQKCFKEWSTKPAIISDMIEYSDSIYLYDEDMITNETVGSNR